ncbi:hypothetical protein [Acidisphaera sp. S103]|uniref:hypothetical protein n=1 Tax=Acidisphaera sp. S103 TaxID=1747223 RepID=UPI00131D2B70|nr:hypothetical protein [Acidisphaera sp. S103]
MRRIALLLLPLAFGGCAYKTWWNAPFTTGSNPNAPVVDSENAQRALGAAIVAPPLLPEPGDIWPGPLPPAPTLQDLEQQGQVTEPEQPVPGSPLSRGTAPPYPSPQPSTGSSTPPGANQPPVPLQSAPPLSSYAAPHAPGPGRQPAGQIYQTPGGPAVTNGGGPGYQTTTTPGGGSSIIVPNGNGTSTIIHSDGRIETVPTPK